MRNDREPWKGFSIQSTATGADWKLISYPTQEVKELGIYTPDPMSHGLRTLGGCMGKWGLLILIWVAKN